MTQTSLRRSWHLRPSRRLVAHVPVFLSLAQVIPSVKRYLAKEPGMVVTGQSES